MKNACDPIVKKELLDRIGGLDPAAKARWGKMNVNEAVCHLTDQLRDISGERPVQYRRNLFIRYAVYPLLSVLPAWPRGRFPAAPEYDQEKDGTKASTFENDRRMLLEMLRRLDLHDPALKLPLHPAFGKLSRAQYGRIVYQHFHHHLTQFGA